MFRQKNKLLLFGLALCIFAILLYWGNLRFYSTNENLKKIAIKNATCHVEDNSCLIENSIFKLTLTMDKKIYFLSAFNVKASSAAKEKYQVKRIQLDFKMTGMDMGVNRILLKPGKLKNNIQYWHGKGLLPVCTSGRADWVAELNIDINHERYHLQFPVIVHKITH